MLLILMVFLSHCGCSCDLLAYPGAFRRFFSALSTTPLQLLQITMQNYKNTLKRWSTLTHSVTLSVWAWSLEISTQHRLISPRPPLNVPAAWLKLLRECLCKSGPVDFPWETDLAHFLCVARHSCTYTKTTIRLIGSLYFSEFYGN